MAFGIADPRVRVFDVRYGNFHADVPLHEQDRFAFDDTGTRYASLTFQGSLITDSLCAAAAFQVVSERMDNPNGASLSHGIRDYPGLPDDKAIRSGQKGASRMDIALSFVARYFFRKFLRFP